MAYINCFAIDCVYCNKEERSCKNDEVYIDFDQITDRRPSCSDYQKEEDDESV